MGLMETVIDIPAEHEANVFGQFDAYAKKIERALHAYASNCPNTLASCSAGISMTVSINPMH